MWEKGRRRRKKKRPNILFNKILLNQLNGEGTLANTTTTDNNDAILLSFAHSVFCCMFLSLSSLALSLWSITHTFFLNSEAID
mmetsp:Transcript_15121/g.38363  ORF Transcript_15121/g.38363 Transcript_15121/m.38363 type:complete len:83 (-) Transcript_15121:172-420(-)